MLHDLQEVKDMFIAADKLLQARPDLLSLSVDEIFNELDGVSAEMNHIRWGVMTRAKMSELTAYDSESILKFLLSVNGSILLNEYIGYILQREHGVSLLQLSLDAYEERKQNEILPFVEPNIEYEDDCFIEWLEDMLGIIAAVNDVGNKTKLIRNYGLLVIKNNKEELVLEEYSSCYSEALEQLVSC